MLFGRCARAIDANRRVGVMGRIADDSQPATVHTRRCGFELYRQLNRLPGSIQCEGEACAGDRESCTRRRY